MGYNTWNAFYCAINETLVKELVDKFVEFQLPEHGYTYFNLDDCWHSKSRTGDGQLQADAARFPSGMHNLSDYVHTKGLQFGMYSDAGLKTCAGYPGSLGHEADDAAMFASWGVDYLKYDNCASLPMDVVHRYTEMRDALNATGRPVLFSMCEWGVANPWTWARQVGNSWRTTDDIQPSWGGMMMCLDGSVGLSQFAGPGGWNDPDMLEVGNGGLSLAEERAHFALWALLKAPLLIGADLRKIQPKSLQILKAKEVIAVNQDPLGVAGDLIFYQGSRQVYAGPLAGGGRAVVLLNRLHTGGPNVVTVTWEMLGLNQTQEATVRDLYAEKDLGTFVGSFSAYVEEHDVSALKIVPLHPTLHPMLHAWRPWHVNKAAVDAVKAARALAAVGVARPGRPHATGGAGLQGRARPPQAAGPHAAGAGRSQAAGHHSGEGVLRGGRKLESGASRSVRRQAV